MTSPGDAVLVAVSGGPDSVFLVHALNYLKDKLGIALSVCTLDHGLRGYESEKDTRFVEALSTTMGLRCIRKKIDLRESKNKGLSTEEAGRAERYAFFRDSAIAVGANVIATGHTIDDQAETVLMRLIKGSSLKGACGIPPAREDARGLKIIRPLIELEKKEIVDYLEENGIDFRVDATNFTRVYFRNVVRHEILPFLERFNPRIKKALSNFAGHLREDSAFINEEKAKRAAGAILKTRDRVSLNLKDIVVQPKALMKEIVRDSLEAANADIKKLSYKHWKEIDNFVRNKRNGSSLDLPGGIRLTRRKKVLEFFKVPPSKSYMTRCTRARGIRNT